MDNRSASVDLITLEVIQQFLVATVREMRATVIRTAHSSVIYEGMDFSCAILDEEAALLALSESGPAHIVPLPAQVQEARAYFKGKLEPGDVLLVNDPYTSGTHLNDVAMVIPLFYGGELLAFMATRAHWGDVGGMYPGSISGRATEIFQEGLRIPFVKVYRNGEPVPGMLELILANVRSPEDTAGDFHAMLASCHTAQVRLTELLDRYGTAVVRACTRRLLDRAEQRMRTAIERIQPGTYYYEDYLDSDNVGVRPVLVRVAITVAGNALTVDFSGSSPQVQGPVNCSMAVTAASTFVALKALLDPNGYVNQGSFRPTTISAPKGTVTNVINPGAVGGFSEMRRRIESIVIGALATAAPAYVAGDNKGSANHAYIGSQDRSGRRRTIFYEYPSGGTGGFLEHDGSSAMRAWDEGDFSSIQPVETVEHEHNLLVEFCELRRDSAGAGLHRGGLGLRRAVRQLGAQGTFSALSDRNILTPFGVCGGLSGAPNRFVVLRGELEVEPSSIPGKVSGFSLLQDDAVLMESAGGGGYGDPLERDVALVARDVHEGYVSRTSAKDIYGVVLQDDGRVDDAGTVRQRALLRDQRVRLTIEEADVDAFADGNRKCLIHRQTLAQLGAAVGTPMEFVSARGAPLRAWFGVSDTISPGSVAMGPIGRAILDARPGTSIEIRLLRDRRNVEQTLAGSARGKLFGGGRRAPAVALAS